MSFRTAYGNAWSENGWRMVNADGCVWSTIPGSNVSVQLRQGVPTTVLVAFASRFNKLIEPLRDADTAGWTPTNSVPTSNHLAGTAMDLNWNSHPFHVKGTFGDRLPKLRELLNSFEGAVFWGGDWRSPIDEMHFQMGWPEGDKRYVNLINKLSGGVPALPQNGLSAETLAQAMGSSVSLQRYRELLPHVKEALLESNCTTLNRIAMWLAQIGHESGGLKYTEEIASGDAYEGRKDLGNVQRGDGRKFKGRSVIQVTGRHNYRKLSEWAYKENLVASPDYFIDNPESLADDENAMLGAVWYWTVARNMNHYADARDINGATRAVNGGLNGLADRVSRWNRCRSMGLAALSVSGSSTAVTTPKTYGMPRGTSITYGSKGFPPWVYTLASGFNLKASTYPGHQEGQRAEKGYAPNTSGLNLGIDWVGSVVDMDRFATYLLGVRSHLEQVIWENPSTRRRVGVAGGENVSATAYYESDYSGHRDHVHTRQSKPIPLPEALLKNTEAGDVFMALSDVEQHELLDLVRQQSAVRRVSRSPLRRVSENVTETITGFAWNMDGSVHVLLMDLLARLGDPNTLKLLNDVANLDPARHPERTHDRQLAQAILNKLLMDSPAQQQVPMMVVEPAAVEPQPAPPTPVEVQVPSEPVDHSGSRDLYGEMNDLRNQIRSLTDALSDLSSAFLGRK